METKPVLDETELLLEACRRTWGEPGELPDLPGDLLRLALHKAVRTGESLSSCCTAAESGRLPPPDQAEEDEVYMRMAIALGNRAAALGEVPVGAVAVWDGEVCGFGFNRRETGKHALAHAELQAIDTSCRKLGGWRLHRCDLYVTLEPCPMCAGAIINSRIRRVIFGAYDPKAGCFGSVADFCALPFNHRPEVVGGVLEAECSALLTDFFQKLRKKRQ